MKRVAFLTIGQSPRDDFVPEMADILGPDIEALQAGALDGLSRDEIAAFAPRDGDYHLVTRLADGTDVVVGKQALYDPLQACFDRLDDTADAFVILCVGAFPNFRSSKPILEPDRILFASTQAIYQDGTLGIVIPLAEQHDATAELFGAITPRLEIRVASPYQGDDALVSAARELERADARLVVMNCMGFNRTMKQRVREVAQVPALLPSSLIARFVREVL